MRRTWLMGAFILGTFACDDSSSGGDASIDASAPPADMDDADDMKPDASLLADGGDVMDPPACEIVAPTACAQPAPSYADVEPIFQRRCVGCHSGEPGGPWPLTAYEHVASWFSEIRAVMLMCAMPPPDSGQTMPDSERDAILAWLRCGTPR